MHSSKQPNSTSNLRTWISITAWRKRIFSFDPSWFTATMGTGIIIQLLNYFPWPAEWLKNLGYVFWILTIVMFAFFTVMSCLRMILYPKVSLSVLDDLAQTSYLGAIPVSLDTIATGIVLYYNSNSGAMYVAEAFYWINVTLTSAVALGGVFAMYRRQGHHQLEDVTGVWLLTFIPMIVTAALGSALSPHLQGNNTATILFVSFLMLSLGLGLSFIITTIYFWRLMTCSLPPRAAIISCFVPVGPLSMGAFAMLSLSLDLSKFVSAGKFVFEESWSPPFDAVAEAAIGQMIIWIGVITTLMLLGIATFFLIEAFASVFAKIPKSFSVGFWSFVFPCGVYANAWCRLSTTLRNDGMKGWAAACVVGTILLWLMCAILTTYEGVWKGETFVAPGLQDYIQKHKSAELPTQSSSSHTDTVFGGQSSSRERQHDVDSDSLPLENKPSRRSNVPGNEDNTSNV